MIKKLTLFNGPQGHGDGRTVSELLAALSLDQYNKLIGFAKYRLRIVTTSRSLQGCLAGLQGEELVAQAVLKLQLGELNPALGRHLKARNRSSLDGFIACLKGVIESDLNHLACQARSRYEHLPVGDSESEPGYFEPEALEDAQGYLSRRDLHQVLFHRLRKRLARKPDLLEVVRDWEERFLEDYRVGNGEDDVNLVHRVRRLAREILAELSAEFLPALDGREMLL